MKNNNSNKKKKKMLCHKVNVMGSNRRSQEVQFIALATVPTYPLAMQSKI